MTIRRFLLVAPCLLLAAGAGLPGTACAAPGGGEASAIRHVLKRQQQAWNRGDVVAFMRGYMDSPDTTFVGSTIRKGYRRILDSYRKHYATRAQMGRLTFSDIEVRLLPGAHGEVDYAVVTGRFHLDRTEHGDAAADDGVFSLLWQKTRDGWKIILDHSS